MRAKLLVFSLLFFTAGVTEAALSKAAQEWRRGPEKFLMTGEEEKAWKGVKSDADAAAFIDLFWARRDPTPGTPRNEFREEFNNRVKYSDTAFAQQRIRGALTDRGQVYILLGPPLSGSRETMSMAGHSGMSSASARSADAFVWTWSREEAVALGVPKLFVNFTQVPGTDVVGRDTKFGQFSNVSEVAIRKNIVSPDLTAAPDWAARVSADVLSGVAAPARSANAKAAGRIGRLLLLSDLNSLDLDAATDPLASLQPVTELAADGDLAYVLEYCGGSGALKIETKIGNATAASELEPAPMKAVAGCAAVPGMLSLSGLKPGRYELEVTTIEASGGRLTTKQAFQIR